MAFKGGITSSSIICLSGFVATAAFAAAGFSFFAGTATVESSFSLSFFSVVTAEVEVSCTAQRNWLSFLLPDCNVNLGNREEEGRVGVVIDIRELGTTNGPPAIAAIFRKSKETVTDLLHQNQDSLDSDSSLHLLPQTKQ
uniref:Uncharacterized protein n=1 Tax=Noccaea caerulescens TaxID=107243 RepID=A0A1J3HQZ1_NOCCA